MSVSNIPKNREVSLDIIEVSMESLLRKQEYLSKLLLEELNHKDLSKALKKHFHNDSCSVHVLNLWACILRLLGEGFFELDRTIVTNPLLKIAEKSFASKSSEVTLALNNLWRALIDVVFMRPDEFSRKMEKIFLLPLKIRYRNEIVANESLKTNWHLICKINMQINDYIDKVVLPLLDVYLSPLTALNNGANIALTTPDQSSKRKSVSRSPKSPHVVNSSTKVLVMEMLTQLLTNQSERVVSKGFKLECFQGPKLSNANLISNFHQILSYIINASESCNETHEFKLSSLWIALMVFLRNENGMEDLGGYPDMKRVWRDLLISMEDVINQSILSIPITLKVLALFPEEVSHFSYPEFRNETNKEGLTWIYIVQLLLNKNILENNGFEHERFFILYERFIGMVFTNVSGQLETTELTFALLEKAHSSISIQDVRWRLWSTLTYLLNGYVCKTNDVNQGNSLQYNFSAMLKALMYPLKSITLSKLQEGTMKELLNAWTESYRTFSRAVNLLSGVELNVALEEIFHSILSMLRNDKTPSQDQKGYSVIIQMSDVAAHCIDFTEIRSFHAADTTPTKVARKFANPLGNFQSFIEVIRLCFVNFTEQLSKNNKSSELSLFELINLIDYMYASITSGLVLSECTGVLVAPIVNLMKKQCSAKLLMKIEKLIYAIYSSFESNENIVFNEHMLDKIEALIIQAIKSGRKPLITRTIKFWNFSFGKRPMLTYSECLKNSLLGCKSKTPLLLPGVQRPSSNRDFLLEDDTAQFPDISQPSVSPRLKTKLSVTASPVKIHGSFLMASIKGEVKPQINLFRSPGKTALNPPSKNTPSPSNNRTVRRKLPIGFLKEESCDFVEIKDSPKKKRLLTDHQKEIRRMRTEMPVMYNNLDQQSQDPTLFYNLTQDLASQDVTVINTVDKLTDQDDNSKESSSQEASQSLLAEINLEEDKNKVSEIIVDNLMQSINVVSAANVGENIASSVVTPEHNEKTNDEKIVEYEHINIIKDDFDPSTAPHVENESSITVISETEDLNVMFCDDNEVKKIENIAVSPDVVPSSQTQELTESPLCRASITTQLRNTTVELLNPKKMDDICLTDVAKSRDFSKNISENIEVIPLLTDDVLVSIAASSYIDSKNMNKDENESKGSKDESVNDTEKVTGETISKPFQEVKREPMIIVQKLPPRPKRKRLSVLSAVNQNKRRKSEGDILKKKMPISSEKPGVKDVFDFGQSEKEKKSSPVAGRLRKKDNKIAKKRHSTGTLVAVTDDLSVTETISKDLVGKSDLNTEDVAQIKTIEQPVEQSSLAIIQSLETCPTPNPDNETTNIDNKTTTISDELISSPTTQGSGVKSDNVVVFPSISATAAVASPVVKFVKNSFMGLSALSPVRKSLKINQSLTASPANGILKKRLNNKIDSPSPPNKSRRVSFQLPEGTVLVKDDTSDLANPIHQIDESPSMKRYTNVKSKLKDQRYNDDGSLKVAVCPELVKCTTPIEKILPSLTFSRGVGHLVRAQNILTIGDLSSLSESQIENLPIRSPKVKTVRNALRTYSSNHPASRDTKPLPKSPLIIAQPQDTSLMMDTATPPKDDTLAKEAALLATPTRHELVKPILLFNDNNDIPGNISDIDSTFDESFACNEVKESEDFVTIIKDSKNADKPVVADMVPSISQMNTVNDDATFTEVVSGELATSENDVRSFFSKIDFTTLSTAAIFDVVSELDQLKVRAMEQLKTRMMSKHSNK